MFWLIGYWLREHMLMSSASQAWRNNRLTGVVIETSRSEERAFCRIHSTRAESSLASWTSWEVHSSLYCRFTSRYNNVLWVSKHIDTQSVMPSTETGQGVLSLVIPSSSPAPCQGLCVLHCHIPHGPDESLSSCFICSGRWVWPKLNRPM